MLGARGFCVVVGLVSVACGPKPSAAPPAKKAQPEPDLGASKKFAKPDAPVPDLTARAEPDSDADAGADEMRVHLINVGQGASTLLEFPCGAVLVDVGGEGPGTYDTAGALSAALAAFFSRRADLQSTLDLVVFTHPHIDHTRAWRAVLDDYTVRNVVSSGLETGSGSSQQKAFEKGAKAAGAKVEHVAAADVPAGGLTSAVIDPLACEGTDPEIRAMWGKVKKADFNWSKTVMDNENNHSVALLVRFGKASILITGDLQEEGIGELVARHADGLDTDVYQVGHHGSHNATTAELLAAMTPTLALIAAGPPDRKGEFTAWAHGHPRLDIVEMLEGVLPGSRPVVDVKLGTGGKKFTAHELRKPIYSTAWDGAVEITLSSDGAVDVTSTEN